MPGSWYTVASGATINAADVNQFSNALHVPVASTETGAYFMAGISNNLGDTLSIWVVTLNHQNAPSTVTIDTSILSPTGLQATFPKTAHFQANGFQVYAGMNATQSDCGAGGIYTASY